MLHWSNSHRFVIRFVVEHRSCCLPRMFCSFDVVIVSPSATTVMGWWQMVASPQLSPLLSFINVINYHYYYYYDKNWRFFFFAWLVDWYVLIHGFVGCLMRCMMGERVFDEHDAWTGASLCWCWLRNKYRQCSEHSSKSTFPFKI